MRRVSRRTVRSPSHAGFSLVELSAVLAILVVVAALSLSGAPKRRQLGQMNACRNRMMFIQQALGTYAADHGGRFPATNTATTSDIPLSQLVPTHTVRTEIFICPGSTHRKLPDARPFAGRQISYSYAMGLTNGAPAEQWLLADAQVNSLAKSVGAPLFSANGQGPGNNHGPHGGNVLFADGHAEASGTNATVEIRLPAGVKLLNPKP